MINVVHIIPWMNIGGTEQVVLDLCKYSSHEITSKVMSIHSGRMLKEFFQAGIEVHIGLDAQAANLISRWADVINLHLVSYTDSLYNFVQALKKPHVVTVHWQERFPKLPCPVICTSDATYQLQLKDQNRVLIRNGIDLSKFYLIPKRKKRKVRLTRICRADKCADYFWEAMQLVLSKYPSAELWIIGEKGESTEQIKFKGIRIDIPKILWSTDIFVYTPFPDAGSMDLVVLEAMATGTPCVLSDVPAVNRSAIHQKTALLVPYGDILGFEKAVSTLIEDQTLRDKLGNNAAMVAKEQFDITKVALKYEAVYRQLLSKASGSPHEGLWSQIPVPS